MPGSLRIYTMNSLNNSPFGECPREPCIDSSPFGECPREPCMDSSSVCDLCRSLRIEVAYKPATIAPFCRCRPPYVRNILSVKKLKEVFRKKNAKQLCSEWHQKLLDQYCIKLFYQYTEPMSGRQTPQHNTRPGKTMMNKMLSFCV
jgi:hypothetical protein